jgi:hypothetical protein
MKNILILMLAVIAFTSCEGQKSTSNNHRTAVKCPCYAADSQGIASRVFAWIDSNQIEDPYLNKSTFIDRNSKLVSAYVDTIFYSPDCSKYVATIGLKTRQRKGLKTENRYSGFVMIGERLNDSVVSVYPFDLCILLKGRDSVVAGKTTRNTMEQQLNNFFYFKKNIDGKNVMVDVETSIYDDDFWKSGFWEKGAVLPGYYNFQLLAITASYDRGPMPARWHHIKTKCL